MHPGLIFNRKNAYFVRCLNCQIIGRAFESLDDDVIHDVEGKPTVM